MAKIEVKGTSITVYSVGNKDFISLTDMIRAKDGDFFISDWLRNRNTVEFLGIWEQVHNPNFNYGGFATIKSQAGLNNYKLSAKEWVAQTNAIELVAKAGRYGGTYAHQDIAFEFGMWIDLPHQRIPAPKRDRARPTGLGHSPQSNQDQLPHPYRRHQNPTDSATTHRPANQSDLRQRGRSSEHGAVWQDRCTVA
jgi:hypothetical protein